MDWMQMIFIFLRSLFRSQAELVAENLALRERSLWPQPATRNGRAHRRCSGCHSMLCSLYVVQRRLAKSFYWREFEL